MNNLIAGGQKMTKKEIRQQRLNRHYLALVKLAESCGVVVDGKKLSVKLLEVERVAHAVATAYCNGENIRISFKGRIPTDCDFRTDENAWENAERAITDQVQRLFMWKLPHLLINADARGYSLKIDSEKGRELIESCGLERDWGGYGLLAPSIK